MTLQFAKIVPNRNFDVQIYFVTNHEQDSSFLAKHFANAAYRVAVNCIRADFRAATTIQSALACGSFCQPSAIIFDYASCGGDVWSLFERLRSAIGDRYVEFVISGLPRAEIDRPELQWGNVTAIFT